MTDTNCILKENAGKNGPSNIIAGVLSTIIIILAICLIIVLVLHIKVKRNTNTKQSVGNVSPPVYYNNPVGETRGTQVTKKVEIVYQDIDGQEQAYADVTTQGATYEELQRERPTHIISESSDKQYAELSVYE